MLQRAVNPIQHSALWLTAFRWTDASQPVPAARALLFWRTPVASAAVCVGWQLLTFYPRYIPSALALLAVQLLNATYAQAASAP